MALVLALRKGQEFYIGNEKLVVQKVLSDVEFDLLDDKTGKVHRITDRKSVEIFENVFVSAGDRVQSMHARVTIEAPRSVRILRGEAYANEVAHGAILDDAPPRV